MRSFSADHFFMQGGEYRFDPSKLGEAHGSCLRNFVLGIQENHVSKVTILRGVPGCGKSTLLKTGAYPMGDVVVDNTSTSVAEVAPYASLALAYGHELEIVTLSVSPEHCHNVHGVPQHAVERMAKALEEGSSQLPPWWKHTILERSKDGGWKVK